MKKNKLFSIFSKPKKSVNISLTSISTTNIIVDVEHDESVDDPKPIVVNVVHQNNEPVKSVHVPTQDVQCGINVILDLGDIDSGPASKKKNGIF
ncbi:unnamed protein product [Macrosiphum euphorbiae]|uniref:Uncharacterized protein n=1 Tax=Macrosiphum euphorbiae TaxID=13131 RepID=A0AAV0Y486_9HEMI|nr:unnamed protein product [Macrosiphum euphorbiae]